MPKDKQSRDSDARKLDKISKKSSKDDRILELGKLIGKKRK